MTLRRVGAAVAWGALEGGLVWMGYRLLTGAIAKPLGFDFPALGILVAGCFFGFEMLLALPEKRKYTEHQVRFGLLTISVAVIVVSYLCILVAYPAFFSS